MKMSAARIRSVFRCRDRVQERVFRAPVRARIPNPALVLAPANELGTEASPSHMDALDRHFRVAVNELAKLGL
jgi:hypothetical protein